MTELRVAPAQADCRLVADAAEAEEHHRIRRAVFVAEQGIFDGTDVDAHDARPDVLHVVAWIDGRAAGVVRLFPLGAAGAWQGDRLAVLPGFRTARVGGPLVRFAVATAAARGGTRMVAHVQRDNRRFFERLGWTARADEIYAGRPHVVMDIDLG
ncbi:MSMEG_0567/Sll0786 family nitrogen starvation N-acetyltransferase [Actinomycetospora callitridis]|uniref:MSMEG_0567/Sll0786 family nitrogen starvation N-acetyltransferase n=1 Tax=Actinomycetospora callitridis TaxID=913944 RepID=UPI0023654C29|nr:MSMEG_0567/Sll0786 family nitrogen starvation N-acetyltransferase [Actinomycetospora callitridis]MDD7918992.1 GNAT family N-acetyltransferase [Actinomycetospora callitridis]